VISKIWKNIFKKLEKLAKFGLGKEKNKILNSKLFVKRQQNH
jgi:hypothetical protein